MNQSQKRKITALERENSELKQQAVLYQKIKVELGGLRNTIHQQRGEIARLKLADEQRARAIARAARSATT